MLMDATPEKLIRDREVIGSNPIAPTFMFNELAGVTGAPAFSM
jgi:hypothetical protein